MSKSSLTVDGNGYVINFTMACPEQRIENKDDNSLLSSLRLEVELDQEQRYAVENLLKKYSDENQRKLLGFNKYNIVIPKRLFGEIEGDDVHSEKNSPAFPSPIKIIPGKRKTAPGKIYNENGTEKCQFYTKRESCESNAKRKHIYCNYHLRVVSNKHQDLKDFKRSRSGSDMDEVDYTSLQSEIDHGFIKLRKISGELRQEDIDLINGYIEN